MHGDERNRNGPRVTSGEIRLHCDQLIVVLGWPFAVNRATSDPWFEEVGGAVVPRSPIATMPDAGRWSVPGAATLTPQYVA